MAAGITALYTIGHGVAPIDQFITWLQASQIASLVDVRRFAGSRRNPQYNSSELRASLAQAGIAYRNAVELGGRRKPRADSENGGLRNEAFRGYADYMETGEFRSAFAELVGEADTAATVVMCSETLWWRCHRRLIADAVVLLGGRPVTHIVSGKLSPHVPTEGVRPIDDRLRYGTGPLGV